MTRRRRESGSLESEVLGLLWAADSPLTTSDVMDGLASGAVPSGRSLAYTTVQTILTRLHAKGAVRREQAGRAHAYTPVLDDAGLAAHRMRAVLDRGGDRAAVLHRFVGALSPEDEQTLLALLREQQADER